MSNVPKGAIMIWSGDAGDVPAGWHICDGTKGTPDLRNLFVLGAGGNYYDGETGGRSVVTLSQANLPPHSHGYTIWQEESNTWRGGGDASSGNGTGGVYGTQTTEVGSGEAISIMPPYVALYYIILL